MGWATVGNVVTTNLDNATDSPASARADIKAALDELKNVINGKDTTNGVAGLDSGGLIPNTSLPNTIISSGSNNLTLDPGSDRVAIQDILNLNPRTVAQAEAISGATAGDVIYVSNGAGGSPCLAVYTGDDDTAGDPIWKRVTLGDPISAS
jgi:hypothetical protein